MAIGAFEYRSWYRDPDGTVVLCVATEYSCDAALVEPSGRARTTTCYSSSLHDFTKLTNREAMSMASESQWEALDALPNDEELEE